MSSEPPSIKSGVKTPLQSYWRRNLRIMVTLLFGWAVAGLGAGVLFADFLNDFTVPATGFPLGFWFAHQGSIIVFVLLILVYCILMNRADDQHHRDIQQNNDGEAK